MPWFNIKTIYPVMVIPIIKIWRSWDRLSFIMDIPIPVRRRLYIVTTRGTRRVTMRAHSYREALKNMVTLFIDTIQWITECMTLCDVYTKCGMTSKSWCHDPTYLVILRHKLHLCVWWISKSYYWMYSILGIVWVILKGVCETCMRTNWAAGIVD